MEKLTNSADVEEVTTASNGHPSLASNFAEIQSLSTFTNVGYIHLRGNVRSGNVLRAFVETGSGSKFILATLAETNLAWMIKELYVGPRHYGSNNGILISITFDSPIPSNVMVDLVVCQQGAAFYKDAILYTGT